MMHSRLRTAIFSSMAAGCAAQMLPGAKIEQTESDMPTLAGWLTGGQVPQEALEQVLTAFRAALEHNGGEPVQNIHPGAALLSFADAAYAQQSGQEPPVLDWVPDRQTLVYHRPLSGLHPLYYLENWPAPGNLLFASEIKALLALGVPRRLHLPALDVLLRYGFLPAPWTVFQDIYIVPAGSILRWQRGKTLINTTQDYQLEQPHSSVTLDQLFARLNDASRELLPPHNQLLGLSGGGTQSLLATLLASQHTVTPPILATLNFTRDEQHPSGLETLAISSPLLTISGLDEPDFWPAALTALEAPDMTTRALAAHQLLHTAAQETGARVAISGLGASLLLNNAIHEQIDAPLALESQQGKSSTSLLTTYQRQLQTGSITAPWSAEAVQQLRGQQPWEETQHARRLERQASKLVDSHLQQYYLDLHLRLPDQIVHPLQRLALQEKIALRSPYLNTHVLDTLTRLPAQLPDGTSKHFITIQLLHRLLPREIGPIYPLAAPTASLLRNQNSEILQQTLSEQAVREKGIFDPEVVTRLLQRQEVSPELLLVFTTQLLCLLFDVGM
jgi:asparagine synthetase B (glutamine-hydrolysing)